MLLSKEHLAGARPDVGVELGRIAGDAMEKDWPAIASSRVIAPLSCTVGQPSAIAVALIASVPPTAWISIAVAVLSETIVISQARSCNVGAMPSLR